MDENNINDISLFISYSGSISNLSELLENISEYEDLCEKYKTLSKIERFNLNEKITDKQSILRRGIKLDNSVILQYIEPVKEFVASFGINYTLIESKLNSLELVISPVYLLEKGKLCNYGKYIAIDYSYAEFDENGNAIGLKEPIVNFFKHTIIHELLHSISNKGLNYMDSFSEGMTEYFAHKISKATNISSDYYGYIERIFYMFGTMIGDDILFEDYVTDIYSMKKLREFTASLGINEEEYKNFKLKLDNFLEKKFKQQNSEELRLLKSQIDEFIFNRIVMPYCSFDKTVAMEMVEGFFSTSEDIKLDLCEIHSNSKEKSYDIT